MSGNACFEAEAGGSVLRPVLVVNPRTDASFVEYVDEQVDGLLDSDPLSLQHRLRERHPGATVHARLLSSEPATVWYIYRDGHWTPTDGATQNEEG
jgi:hypothetical protein